MIEGIGSIVRYMGTNWINGCFGTPPVWGGLEKILKQKTRYAMNQKKKNHSSSY